MTSNWVRRRKGKKGDSSGISVPQLEVMETSWVGVAWRAEVILSYQRKKLALCLRPPLINQEPCKTAGKSKALCFIFQPGVGDRGCFSGEQASSTVCRKLAGHLFQPSVPLTQQGSWSHRPGKSLARPGHPPTPGWGT